MRLRNFGSYESDDLRAWVRAACKAYDIPLNRLVVQVYDFYQGRMRYSRAVLGSRKKPGRWMRLVLKQNSDDGTWLKYQGDYVPGTDAHYDLAHTTYHEILHLIGVEHRGMSKAQLYTNAAKEAGVTFPWADGLTVRRCAPVPKPELMPQAERIALATAARRANSARREERLRAALQQAESDLRRAQRRVRKLRTRLRHYDRKRAAAPVG